MSSINIRLFSRQQCYYCLYLNLNYFFTYQKEKMSLCCTGMRDPAGIYIVQGYFSLKNFNQCFVKIKLTSDISATYSLYDSEETIPLGLLYLLLQKSPFSGLDFRKKNLRASWLLSFQIWSPAQISSENFQPFTFT